jgi:hypothetical protein
LKILKQLRYEDSIDEEDFFREINAVIYVTEEEFN